MEMLYGVLSICVHKIWTLHQGGVEKNILYSMALNFTAKLSCLSFYLQN